VLRARHAQVTTLVLPPFNSTDASLEFVSVELAGGAPPGLLKGTRTAPFADGVAIFTDLFISAAGDYRLRFAAGNASANASVAVLSRPFNVTNGPPARMLLDWAPQAAWFEAGLPFAVLPSLTVVDAAGNTVLDQSVTVQVTAHAPRPALLTSPRRAPRPELTCVRGAARCRWWLAPRRSLPRG
jgi:hypothetical protein